MGRLLRDCGRERALALAAALLCLASPGTGAQSGSGGSPLLQSYPQTYQRGTQIFAALPLPDTAALREFLEGRDGPRVGPSVEPRAETDVPGRKDLDAVHGYRLPFGNNPYSPSEAKADFSGFLKPTDFPSAQYCSHCHAAVHAQWRESAHANSFRTPWYVKNVNELAKDKGAEATRHCEGCHNPAALFTGALTTGSTLQRPHDDDGVTCMVCHSIREIQSTRGTGSYVMGKPAVLVDAKGEPVVEAGGGLPSDAEIMAHLDQHRQAVMRPLYKTSEYCAACHKAAIPPMLNQYKWLRTFATWDEWQQSSWSTETPLPFYTKPAVSGCQTCHMVREPSSDAASPGHMAASHRWLGANTAIPTLYGYSEQLKRVEEYLKNDQIEIDIFAMTVEHSAPGKREGATLLASFSPGELIAPLGSRPVTVLPGDTVRVDVVVRNKGIGHALVPELRDFYESWIDFQATDDAGKLIYRSGAVDKAGDVDPEARSYTTHILDHDGKDLQHHEVWKIYVKGYDATISPGRSDVIRYRFRVPEGTTGFRMSAALNYRRFRQSFVNWVYDEPAGSPQRFPTVTLASASLHLRTGMNRPWMAAGTAETPEHLRWNNYGIGMIDRQQFAEASDAFRHVVELQPKYEPGYVNVAIAEYMRGRYVESLTWLDKAKAMSADDQRAAYYRGLCLRWTGKFDEAIAVLQPVADRYPRFRQVHQELGYVLMQRRRYAEARTQYEMVLQVDPDDAVTHRWLGPVYAALGDKKRAAEESALAAQTGNDTAAGWTAQRYWRENLDVASEAMPGHTHSAANKMDDADVRRVLQLQNPPSYIWVER